MPNAASNPPCFLLSSPRAGSTLVSRVLDSHSKISSPCEICVPYVVRSCWKLQKSIASMRKICDYYGVRIPRPALRLARRRMARGHMDKLVAQILLREEKETLVIKDPRHAVHSAGIERLYADEPPKYLLLHRDARAVCHSFVSTLGREPERGFRVWLEASRQMLACERQFPERCLSVRFEDFLSIPELTVARITRFMGHSFEREMLEYGQSSHADDHLGLWTNPRLISSVNRGAIESAKQSEWWSNQSVLDMYDASPAVQELNRELGYGDPVVAEEQPLVRRAA
ncbi:MAG: sulfotransferase [Pirellulales bacterium]|nr:sulfotransferase [Pirellulales bacterium]